MDKQNSSGGLENVIGAVQNIKTLMAFGTIGWPAAIAIIVPAVIVFIILMGSPGQSSEVNTGQSNQEQTQNTTQNVSGLLSFSNATTDEQNLISGFFQETTIYSGYQKFLTSGAPVNISFGYDPDLGEGLCGGEVDRSTNTINFYNFPTSICGVKDKKYMFFHESGHVIANRNQDLFNNFVLSLNGPSNNPGSGLLAQDTSCYSNNFLKTYDQAYGAICGYACEDFAEAIADSLLGNISTPNGSFNNFSKDCPATYAWIRNNVLLGQ